MLPLVPGLRLHGLGPLGQPSSRPSGDGATPSAALRPVLRGIGLFVAGFTLVFVALGATASSIGRILKAHEITLTHVSGIVIVVLGVVMLLSALPERVWVNAGSGTLGMVLAGDRRAPLRRAPLQARRVGARR